MTFQLIASGTLLLSTNAMRPGVGLCRSSYLLSRASAASTFAFAKRNVNSALDPCAEGVFFGGSTKIIPAQGGLQGARNFLTYGWRALDSSLKGKVFYTTNASGSNEYNLDEDGMPPQRTYADTNLDARMRMKAYRREALQQRYASEMEIDRNKYDLDPAKLLQKGDPDTIQGVIKEIITQGYFVTLPEGKEGFLPSRELGCIGGIPLLSKLMKVGQEITCRAVRVGGYGRLVIAIKKDTPVDMPDRPYQGFRQGPGDRDLPSRRWRNNR